MIRRWSTIGNAKPLHESLLIVVRLNRRMNTTFPSLLHRFHWWIDIRS